MSNLTKELEEKNQLEKERKDPYSVIKRYLTLSKEQIALALPKHLTPDRVLRLALTEARKNPKLLQCSPNSLVGAVIQASQLGLEIGLLGHCYLIPYGGHVEFQISYLGLLELVRRSDCLASITVQEIRKNDIFDCSYGSEQFLKHKPLLTGRGEVVAYYCYTRLKNNEESFHIMTVEDIREHALKYSKSQKNGKLTGAWKDSFSGMAKKTVIKQHIKYLPVSIEIQGEQKINPSTLDETIHSVSEEGGGLETEIIIDHDDDETPQKIELIPDGQKEEKEKKIRMKNRKKKLKELTEMSHKIKNLPSFMSVKSIKLEVKDMTLEQLIITEKELIAFLEKEKILNKEEEEEEEVPEQTAQSTYDNLWTLLNEGKKAAFLSERRNMKKSVKLSECYGTDQEKEFLDYLDEFVEQNA